MERLWLDRSRKNAQVFSGEFLIAYFIFAIALVLVFYMWDTTTADIMQFEHLYKLEDISVDVAEKLIKTKGIPENWSSDDVDSIGLVSGSRILDSEKVLKFLKMMNSSNSNYEDNKYLLGIGKYDFHFEITDIDGTVIKINNLTCETGKPPVNETYMLTVTRTAILNNEIVRTILTVWEQE